MFKHAAHLIYKLVAVVWMRNFSSANDFIVAVKVIIVTSARIIRYRQALKACCKTSLRLFLLVNLRLNGCYLAVFYHTKCL